MVWLWQHPRHISCYILHIYEHLITRTIVKCRAWIWGGAGGRWVARGQSILTDGLLVCEVMQFLHVCVCVCAWLVQSTMVTTSEQCLIATLLRTYHAFSIQSTTCVYSLYNIIMSVSSVQIQLDRFSRLDEHSSPTCNRQTDRQTDQSCPWVYFVWPNPTLPISWLTQPNPNCYKCKNLDPTLPDPIQLKHLTAWCNRIVSNCGLNALT